MFLKLQIKIMTDKMDIRTYIKTLIFILCLILIPVKSISQNISGTVTDSITGEPIPYLAVYYEGKGIGTITDDEGKYSIEIVPSSPILTFAAIGYTTKTINISQANNKTINVIMSPADFKLDEVVVKPKKEKYSRKNNPAVELIEKVIAHKSAQKLEDNDFYQYSIYEKMTTSLDDINSDMFDKGIFKKMPFLIDQVQPCIETNKLILPVSIQERAIKRLYRKNPESKKDIVEGETSNGVDQFFTTGNILGSTLKDLFKNIDIYENNIDLLHLRFTSPISSANAVSFYKYYIMDTVYVDSLKCIDLSFVPNNSQDFGFTGHLYIIADSTYAIKKCVMNLPKNTGVNFVNNMIIQQEFTRLDNGQWVISKDDMLAELYVVDAIQGVQVRRQTRYDDYSFEPIMPNLFKLKGDVIRENDADMKGEDFWAEKRKVPMSKQESKLSNFIERLEQVPGVNYVVFVLKMFFENFIEVSFNGEPSKFDFGPINTMFTTNYVDGFRLRLSGQTTAQLNPHLFASGYGAYGFKDRKFKYMGKLEYSFDKKKFLAREFPKHSISISHQYDVMSPMDKFLRTDKDNVFVSLKATTVDQMSYVRDTKIEYEQETMSGFSYKITASHKIDNPTGNLFYIPNNTELKTDNFRLGSQDYHNYMRSLSIDEIMTTEFGISLRYAPGETFINTKQRRRPLNLDAPVFTLSHTVGVKGLFGGDYNYNYTELSFFKRIWMRSWGKMDINIKGGIQWNKVPFPMLIMPEANLSFITQKNTFNLINNMEFLNDRFASLMINYDMGGKLFNRIPLFRKLKLREAFGFNLLYGNLSDKNNPFKNPDDSYLFRFPERNGQQTSFVMNHMPYMEFTVGIHNILNFIHIDYVRRITYLDNPNINKHGVRLMMMVLF